MVIRRPLVSRIGDVHEFSPQRLYVGASATPAAWSRVFIDAMVAGRPVRVLIDEETVPTLQLMSTVSELAALAGLHASWVLDLPRSVDLTVSVFLAPGQPTRSHGSETDPAGQDGAPAPTPPVGAGSISQPATSRRT